jgi:enolase-phosphatase E1
VIKAVVTDIEGTTSSLSFVKDVLFPYARAHLAEFMRAQAQDPRVAPHLDAVRGEAGDPALTLDGVIGRLLEWIDQDRKFTPLKALQGMIWESGYRNGDFQGHVYADAEQALRDWRACGLALYVYSSGSVQAQKLLFAHTGFGDLTPLFDGYYDTTVGGKRETGSYRAIAADIGVAPQEILFLSDVRAELDAAAAAGYRTVWLVRDGALDPRAAHPQVRDFREIAIFVARISEAQSGVLG